LSTVYALENRLHSLEMSINTGEELSKLKLMYHNYRLLLLVEYASVVNVCKILLQILESAKALLDMLQRQ